MKNLGARINKAIYKVEELQARLAARLKELEEEEATHPLYEVTTEGIEICWGFNTACTNKGDCDNCTKLNDYNNITVPFHDDPFTDKEDYGLFDYDPAYSPLIDRDIPF